MKVSPRERGGRDSVVGIVIRYGLTVQGSNTGGGNNFISRLDRPWNPPSFLYKGNRISLTGVKQPGRGLTTHPV